MAATAAPGALAGAPSADTTTDAPAAPAGSRSIAAALSRHRILVAAAGAFVVALVVAIQNRPTVLYDDAAIILRYAHRIGSGEGWTYNPGDQTNGASAPLYTMVLAVAGAVGVDLELAARAVCTVSYAACVAAVTYLGAKIVGFVTGLVAAVFLLTWFDFQTQGLAGMESTFAAMLGLGVLIALVHGKDTWAGVLLGLALLNKLDAGMLAVAVAVAYVAVNRRPPWRIAAISAAILAPWILFSWVYFGSPLPNSFTQKLTNEANASAGATHDVEWILSSLRGQNVMLLVALALAAAFAVPRLARTRPAAAVALAVCIAWPVLHAIVFSLLDLGDPFPWYLAVLYPPLALGAASALGFAAKAAQGAGRPVGLAVLAATAAVAIGLASDGFGATGATLEAVRDGHEQTEFEAFEWARRDAAVHLASIVEPDEVIATCFGWFAYEAIDNTIWEVCPLNTRDPVPEPSWYTPVTFPGVGAPVLIEGMTLERTFTSPVGQQGRIDIVRLEPGVLAAAEG